ncbi:MAG: hypothetical protein EZS28_035800, partial [Streblomastix strix]
MVEFQINSLDTVKIVLQQEQELFSMSFEQMAFAQHPSFGLLAYLCSVIDAISIFIIITQEHIIFPFLFVLEHFMLLIVTGVIVAIVIVLAVLMSILNATYPKRLTFKQIIMLITALVVLSATISVTAT